MFARVKKLVPDFRKKVFAVSGEVSYDRLGLSDSDYQFLASRISVIFHGAATVKFDQDLKTATLINAGGTLETLKFSKDCEKLEVSTSVQLRKIIFVILI